MIVHKLKLFTGKAGPEQSRHCKNKTKLSITLFSKLLNLLYILESASICLMHLTWNCLFYKYIPGGDRLKFQDNVAFQIVKIVFVSINSADPDEMPQS